MCTNTRTHMCVRVFERNFLFEFPVPFKTTLEQGNFQFPLTCKHAVLPQPL